MCAVSRWSLGVLLYEFVTGTVPFYSEDRFEMFCKIQNDSPIFPYYARLSSECKSLISKVQTEPRVSTVLTACCCYSCCVVTLHSAWAVRVVLMKSKRTLSLRNTMLIGTSTVHVSLPLLSCSCFCLCTGCCTKRLRCQSSRTSLLTLIRAISMQNTPQNRYA